MHSLLKTSLFISITFALGCSSQQLRPETSSQKLRDYQSDQDLAEIPSAVTGGLYLLDCNHDPEAVSKDNAESDCSIMLEQSGQKAKLSDHFSETELQLKLVDGVVMVKKSNTQESNSHWTVRLTREDSRLSMSEILASLKFTFTGKTLDGEPIKEKASSVARKPEQSREYSFDDLKKKADDLNYQITSYNDQIYILGKENESCNDSCLALPLRFDLSATKGINKEDECENVFKVLNDEKYNNDVSVVHDISEHFFKAVKQSSPNVGCSEGKAHDSYHHIFTEDVYGDAKFSDPHPGRRVCGCKR
jgi:hypothetical protein